jgi:hypothetical protein
LGGDREPDDLDAMGADEVRNSQVLVDEDGARKVVA